MAHVSATIVSPKVAAEHGKRFGYSPEATAGTGPYRVVRWRKDIELVLERFDDYFGENGKLDAVVYRPIPEAASRIIALESGDVDVITHIPPPDLPRLESDPDVQVLEDPQHWRSAVSLSLQAVALHRPSGPPGDLLRDRPPVDSREPDAGHGAGVHRTSHAPDSRARRSRGDPLRPGQGAGAPR